MTKAGKDRSFKPATAQLLGEVLDRGRLVLRRPSKTCQKLERFISNEPGDREVRRLAEDVARELTSPIDPVRLRDAVVAIGT